LFFGLLVLGLHFYRKKQNLPAARATTVGARITAVGPAAATHAQHHVAKATLIDAMHTTKKIADADDDTSLGGR
jgi:hypothetical protein